MIQIRAVLFDLDRTLFDHDGASRLGLSELHNAYGAPFGEDMDSVYAKWDEALERHYERYLAGEIGYGDQRRERIRSFFDERFTDEEANKRFTIYYDSYERHWVLFPDVILCLEALSGLQMGIVSNGDGALQNGKAERLGLTSRVGAVIISGDVGVRKPSPEIYLLACGRLGVKPEETAFVGDRLKDDAQGALAAGLHAIWLDRDGSGQQVPAGITVIHSLKELPGLILK